MEWGGGWRGGRGRRKRRGRVSWREYRSWKETIGRGNISIIIKEK